MQAQSDVCEKEKGLLYGAEFTDGWISTLYY